MTAITPDGHVVPGTRGERRRPAPAAPAARTEIGVSARTHNVAGRISPTPARGHVHSSGVRQRPGSTTIISTGGGGRITVTSAKAWGLVTLIAGIALAILGACLTPFEPISGLTCLGTGVALAITGGIIYGLSR